MASSEVNTVAQIAAGAKVIAAISELKCHKMERKPLDHVYISRLREGSLAWENRKWKKPFEGTGGVLKHLLYFPF